MNKIVLEAMRFCKNGHAGQVRKYTNEPYIVHPFAVAGLVSSVTDDHHMIAAAYLHDVVEDTFYSIDDIIGAFGYMIAELVAGLTDVSKPSDGNRKKRKEIDRTHLSKASQDIKTIKLADLIDNTKSIVAFDQSFAKVYMAEKRRLLVDLRQGDANLWNIANGLISLYYGEQK